MKNKIDNINQLINFFKYELACVDEDALALLENIQADILSLKKDELRLDWLGDMAQLTGNVQLPTECVLNNADSLRGAIDEAMSIEQDDPLGR